MGQKVKALMRGICGVTQKLGTRKLYHKLQGKLSLLKVERAKLFRMLKANHML